MSRYGFHHILKKLNNIATTRTNLMLHVDSLHSRSYHIL